MVMETILYVLLLTHPVAEKGIEAVPQQMRGEVLQSEQRTFETLDTLWRQYRAQLVIQQSA